MKHRRYSLTNIQPRCFERKKWGTPTPIVLSASGYLKPCNYYASFGHFEDLIEWAKANNLDWQKDLDITNGVHAIYESPTWKKLIQVLTDEQHNTPKTCRKECKKATGDIQNDY